MKMTHFHNHCGKHFIPLSSLIFTGNSANKYINYIPIFLFLFWPLPNNRYLANTSTWSIAGKNLKLTCLLGYNAAISSTNSISDYSSLRWFGVTNYSINTSAISGLIFMTLKSCTCSYLVDFKLWLLREKQERSYNCNWLSLHFS